jgi:hypothetical protein
VADELELVELAARELRIGDVLVLPTGIRRRVLELEEYLEETGSSPGPRLSVVVEGGGSATWEHARSGHAGARSSKLVEQADRAATEDERLEWRAEDAAFAHELEAERLEKTAGVDVELEQALDVLRRYMDTLTNFQRQSAFLDWCRGEILRGPRSERTRG